MDNSLFTIITFYQFKKISQIKKFQNELSDFCKFNKIKGTVILAKEGINGSLAGFDISIRLLIIFLNKNKFLNLKPKYSYYKFMPFNRLKIKIKNEIVTFRSKTINPETETGIHIGVKEWNKILKEKNTILIDVRNDFEIQLGTFKDSLNPKTKNFNEFKKYVDINLINYKNKKIAMFCTGGIRCEKASSYMIKQGFKNVNQLEGGILNYLEKNDSKESSWIGECFVFDNRVSLKKNLKTGTYELCHACRYPINTKDKKSKMFKKGLSCPKCFGKISNAKKKRLLERNKQIKISKKKGLYNPYLRQTLRDF